MERVMIERISKTGSQTTLKKTYFRRKQRYREKTHSYLAGSQGTENHLIEFLWK